MDWLQIAVGIVCGVGLLLIFWYLKKISALTGREKEGGEE